MHNADRLLNYINTTTQAGESWIDALINSAKEFQPIHTGWISSKHLTADSVNAYGILHSDRSTSIYIIRLRPAVQILPLTFSAEEVEQALAFSTQLLTNPLAALAQCELAGPGE